MDWTRWSATVDLGSWVERPRPVAVNRCAFQLVAHRFVFAAGALRKRRRRLPSVRCQASRAAPARRRCAAWVLTVRAPRRAGRAPRPMNRLHDDPRRRSNMTRRPRARRSHVACCRGRTGRGIPASRGVPRRDAKGSPGPAHGGSAGSGNRTARAFVNALYATCTPSGGRRCCARGRLSHWRVPSGRLGAAGAVCAGGRPHS
jgi:hypothetical protein